MTPKEASAAWGITDRRVILLCKEGRVAGAYKDGRKWVIPDGAAKPMSKWRNATVRRSSVAKKLPLPIGISDYRKASTEYYYVDKTLLLRDFLDERPQVSLFLRPRRFGKTLNMDMIRTFFEKSEEDTSVYFRSKKIWACGEEYRKHQCAYPVIYLSFKDIKCDSWDDTYQLLIKIIALEFIRHSELADSHRISISEVYQRIISGQADEMEYAMSLKYLSQMLHEHHGIAPIIIIDEYDTPIQQGHVKGFYDKTVSFMRNLFSGGLKDNQHLSFGFLTGILRVAQESIFSGLNNLKINSVLDNRYSQYFGFTADEVQEMAAYYNAEDKYSEICDWYDGYRFGSTEIFNPWSVIGYFNNECIAKPFWLYTSSNDIIGEVLTTATPDIMDRLESLLRGESFVSYIDIDVIYPQLQKNPSSIYSFLLVSGYLKTVESAQPSGAGYMTRVALPNKEIAAVYKSEILSRFADLIPPSVATGIQEAIYVMDISSLQKKLEAFLMQAVSFHDTANEAFYHGLILGLCAVMDNSYRVSSNREAGNGRFDIQMQPQNPKLPGILVEIKSEKNSTPKQLEALSKAALEQINDRGYSTEMVSQGVRRILKYGIAFSGKNVSVTAEDIVPD